MALKGSRHHAPQTAWTCTAASPGMEGCLRSLACSLAHSEKLTRCVFTEGKRAGLHLSGQCQDHSHPTVHRSSQAALGQAVLTLPGEARQGPLSTPPPPFP